MVLWNIEVDKPIAPVRLRRGFLDNNAMRRYDYTESDLCPCTG